jgi:hypothetical protein
MVNPLNTSPPPDAQAGPSVEGVSTVLSIIFYDDAMSDCSHTPLLSPEGDWLDSIYAIYVLAPRCHQCMPLLDADASKPPFGVVGVLFPTICA